jgi:hypothetical protein
MRRDVEQGGSFSDRVMGPVIPYIPIIAKELWKMLVVKFIQIILDFDAVNFGKPSNFPVANEKSLFRRPSVIFMIG